MHEGQQDSDLLAVPFGEVLDAAVEIQVEPVSKIVGETGVGQVGALATQTSWSRTLMRPIRDSSPGR